MCTNLLWAEVKHASNDKLYIKLLTNARNTLQITENLGFLDFYMGARFSAKTENFTENSTVSVNEKAYNLTGRHSQTP